jgi:hypothetical protein
MVKTRENLKYYVKLISKIQRTQTDSDFVPTYLYDYKIMFYENNTTAYFCIEENDLENDFNDNDFDFIFHYLKKEYNYGGR